MATVLIAHGYPAMRAGLWGALPQAQGIEVVAEASAGEEALQLIQKFRPDVALLDGRLSGALDAVAVADCIRAAGLLVAPSTTNRLNSESLQVTRWNLAHRARGSTV